MAARGSCEVCGDEFVLRSDGTVRAHRTDGIHPCPGSGEAPRARHVHRCACGATWDEHVND